jgi:hypothetical protein
MWANINLPGIELSYYKGRGRSTNKLCNGVVLSDQGKDAGVGSTRPFDAMSSDRMISIQFFVCETTCTIRTSC